MAIDSEPIRARGIIVKYCIVTFSLDLCSLFQLGVQIVGTAQRDCEQKTSSGLKIKEF